MLYEKDRVKYLLLAFSLLGLGAMVYLMLSFSLSVIPTNACDINSQINCANVVTSSFSPIIAGIDLYYYGEAFFIVMAALSAIFIWGREGKLHKTASVLLPVFSLLATFFAFYLIYLELFRIHSICLLCTTGHISIFALLIVSLIEYRRHGLR
jgi:uncharacterized membrane protein